MLGGWDPSNNGYSIGSVVVITLFQALSFVYCGRTQGKPLQDFARILTPFSLVAGVGILLGQWVSTHYASDGSDLLLLFGLMGGSVVLWSSGLMISYARSFRRFEPGIRSWPRAPSQTPRRLKLWTSSSQSPLPRSKRSL